jgi:predicted enzyme related to lactoylglutathione lyase
MSHTPTPAAQTTDKIVRLRLELFVDDVQRSMQFYERALGFTPRPGKTPSDHYAELVNGVVQLGLGAMTSLSDDHYSAWPAPNAQVLGSR